MLALSNRRLLPSQAIVQTADFHRGHKAIASTLFATLPQLPVSPFACRSCMLICSLSASSFKAAEINFLCAHKKLRNKRLAPVLIKEVTRRVNLKGIWQAVYTAGVVIPTPISTCRYVSSSVILPQADACADTTTETSTRQNSSTLASPPSAEAKPSPASSANTLSPPHRSSPDGAQ